MRLLKLIFIAMIAFSSLTAKAAGWLEGVNIVNQDLRVWGWGCDRAVPNDQVWVHIWRDDNVFLGAAPANIYRESAVGASCGGSSVHGFYAKITVPENLLDWKNHEVRVSVVGPSGPERLSPSQSVVFSGLDNVSRPRNPGDVVGRDYLGPYVGHVGLWDGSRVYQMTGETGGPLPTMSSEAIETFNAYSKPWGAVTPNLPWGLYVKKCYMRTCNSDNERGTLAASAAIAARAFQIYLIGADYTSTAFYTSAREGRDVRGDVWPALRGLYRCDTYVKDSYRVMNPRDSFTENLYAREIINAPSDWQRRIDNFSSGENWPRLMFDKIPTFFP